MAARASCLSCSLLTGVEPDPMFLYDIRFHDMRHEATSRLFEKGFADSEVASITGHKTLRQMRDYTHLVAERLASRLG